MEQIADPRKALEASKAKDAHRSSLFAAVREGLDREHAQTLNRKAVIERRKEEAERRAKDAAAEAAELALEAETRRKALEAVRVRVRAAMSMVEWSTNK